MRRSRCSPSGGGARVQWRIGGHVLLGLVVVSMAVLWLAPPARGQIADPVPPSGVGGEAGASECCLVLLLPVGARTVSVGRAITARSTPGAVFANPAGLAGLDDDQAVVHHATNVAGQANALSLLFTPDIVGTFGLSYQLFDHGDIETRDEDGFKTGELSLRDHLLIASFATAIYGGVAGGVNLKLYQFRIACRGNCADHEISATTYGVDAGLQFRPAWLSGLQVGAAVSNLGLPLQVVNAPQSDPLPSRLRIGAAYELLRHLGTVETAALWLGVEAVDRWRQLGSPAGSVGVEFAAQNMIFLRAGYIPGAGVDGGASVGVGVRHADFVVDVAKSFTASVLDPESEPFQVSFALSF